MMQKPLSVSLALAFAVLPNIAAAALEAQNMRYTCERGVEIPVVYVTSDDTLVAVLTVEGRQILLYSEPSASGLRYGWPSDGSNYVWWSKGTEAMLLWHDGTADTETTLFATCKQN
jgi:membrane-bound inhibitor of C-type lysozyme